MSTAIIPLMHRSAAFSRLPLKAFETEKNYHADSTIFSGKFKNDCQGEVPVRTSASCASGLATCGLFGRHSRCLFEAFDCKLILVSPEMTKAIFWIIVDESVSRGDFKISQ
jgi:hypothetical protein